MAVRGVAEPGGDFVVSGVCFMGLAPQPPRPPPPAEDKYVALVSGLGLGRSDADLLKVRACGVLDEGLRWCWHGF